MSRQSTKSPLSSYLSPIFGAWRHASTSAVAVTVSVVAMFVFPALAAAETGLQLSLSSNPVVLGQHTLATVKASDLVLPDDVSMTDVKIVFERSVSSDSGSPVAPSTPGSQWQPFSDPSLRLDTSYSASITLRSADFGVGEYGIRVRMIVPTLNDSFASALFTVAGN